MKQDLYTYILGIADNNLILGQRLGELCGHGPSLETDIACTNISLDLLGQVRSYYQYAAQLNERLTSEDQIAFMRTEREYLNVLLVEQPNTNFAYTIARQFLYDIFHKLFIQNLQNSTDQTLVAIANKAIKEVSYHQRFSSDWIVRLGDGTDESHEKIQTAIDDLWTYTNELFQLTPNDEQMIKAGKGVNTALFKDTYYAQINSILNEATLATPQSKWFQKGGKEGIHTEHMGYILSDLQYMQRTYPNMEW
ncbi:phenylacetate-CoA oxygenase subunit PaaC [Flavobacteriaceae bacterium F08102]|nr:phenylacetate-CoA oxygenase subunit PaaC [Flavobacteriaceae bacterium F08102]